MSLFGLTPYLGLRNYPALAMFSNLRVEAGRSNHLFIGDDFDLTGWQRDYVTVHDTDIPALQLLQIDLGQRFTPATLRSLASVNVSAEFWITPPLSAWPYPPTRAFVPYSAPFLELRRRWDRAGTLLLGPGAGRRVGGLNGSIGGSQLGSSRVEQTHDVWRQEIPGQGCRVPRSTSFLSCSLESRGFARTANW